MVELLLSVVIPVHESAPLLPSLHVRLREALQGQDGVEFLYVEDASTDASATVLRALAREDPAVRVVLLSRNIGQQEATLCGLSQAKGLYIANLDDDLQHPPALLPILWDTLRREELDIVYAVPKGGEGPLRRLGGILRDGFFRFAFHLPCAVRVSSYRLMTRALAERVLAGRSDFTYFSALVFSEPTRAATLSYPYQPRPAGHSGYSPLRRARLYLRILRQYGPFAPKQKKPPLPFPIKEVFHAGTTG